MKSEPKFKIGDRCDFVWKVGQINEVLDDNMVIENEPFWYDYYNHPNKGYWLYPIVGKANETPEDLLRLHRSS
jgi:hypothetical protein